MKYEIVEYANELNDLNLSKFSVLDKRIFFSILSQCKNQPAGKEIVMKKEDLIRLGIYPERKRVTIRQFAKDLSQVVSQCYSMYFHKLEETEEEIWIRTIRLFDKIDIKVDKKTPKDLSKIELHFTIEEKAKEFLDTVLPFTSFPLLEFQSLRSSYSQDLFIHLKQFRNQGMFFVKEKDFRKYLNIPNSYRQCDIDKRILVETLKELEPFFPNLRYKKVRSEIDRRRIGRYEFYWDVPQKPGSKHHPINKKEELPSIEEILLFREKEGITCFSVEEMIEILTKKAEKEPIRSWKAYLKGAARIKEKSIKENRHSIPEDHPSWWDDKSEKASPELMLKVLILEKLLRENFSKEELIGDIEELMDETGLDEETVLKAIEEA